MANKVESLSIRKAAKPTTMQLAVQNLSHFPKSSRGPVGFFALHLMPPPPNWQNINLYKIHTCSVNCIKKLKIISKSFTLKGFTRSGSLFASALARAVSCSGGLLAAFPFLWAVPVWERESEREREVQRKALTLSAQTQTWRLPPPTTSDESVAKK